MPPRYDGAGVAVSTSTNAITEKQTPAIAADTSMWYSVKRVQPKNVERHMLQRLDVLDDRQRKQEKKTDSEVSTTNETSRLRWNFCRERQRLHSTKCCS